MDRIDLLQVRPWLVGSMMVILAAGNMVVSPPVDPVATAVVWTEGGEVASLDERPVVQTMIRSSFWRTDFAEQEVVDRVEIGFETEYEAADELAYGVEELAQTGKLGWEEYRYRVSSWQGNEYARELLSVERDAPQNKIVRVGTRREYVDLNLPEGDYRFYQKIRMWATSYDGNCAGCSGRTATGTPVTHGICAVDPQVIPLGSRVYVPGYGVCLAADTGGSIKGAIIDLGFDNVRQGWWSSRYAEVYLLE